MMIPWSVQLQLLWLGATLALSPWSFIREHRVVIASLTFVLKLEPLPLPLLALVVHPGYIPEE